MIDMSGALSECLSMLNSLFNSVISYLNSVYLFPHVTLLGFLIGLAILGMLISSVFVLYDGDVDEV